MRFASLLLVLVGCGDGPSEMVFIPDASPFPSACPVGLELEGSTVPFNRSPIEVYLPAGTDSVSVDLSAAGSIAVDFTELRPDFEDRDFEPTRNDVTCPTSIALDSLLALADGDEVLSATVELGHSEAIDVRRARLFVPLASVEPTIDVDAPTEDSYLIFEPAAGRHRLFIAAWTGSAPSLPDLPGTLAIVRSDELVEIDGVIVAPEGFAGTWRWRVEQWWGAAVTEWSESVELRAIADEAVPLQPAGEEVTELEGDVLWALPIGESTNVLGVPCGGSVTVQSTGFETTQIDDAMLEPFGALTLPLDCEGMTSIDVTTTSLNGRRPLLLVSFDPEVE